MRETSDLDGKIRMIRSSFSDVVGAKLVCYETAELLLDEGGWGPWPDLPIRLHTDTQKVIAISWSESDDLWIASDCSLPFSIEGQTVRWVRNSVENINSVIGNRIRSVMIGRGQMAVEGRALEIWTRLVIEADNGWLEIFNALDENGYDFHVRRPVGDFISCIERGDSADRPHE